ncbi:MAG: hypothetical protein EBR02_07180 [Alphaproteobacteria bacterium]|nr:hypothetical protein [Alphaproteobacteria bacterium]
MAVRFFNGGRDNNGKKSPASELMRLEMQKKGKLSSVDRYKFLLQKKLQASKEEAMLKSSHNGFSLPGTKSGARTMSKKAEDALKQIAMKKAAKQAKVMRQMVVVQPKNWYNGSIDKKGKIRDVAGNYVGKVNTKNGKIGFFSGFESGKYKPKSLATELFIQDSINRYSPYFINLRKMQQMQQGMYPIVGLPDQDVINLYGRTASSAPQQITNVFGTDQDGVQRTNVGVTAWGAVSDNVWGNFADNAWGTMVDNVWGTTESNVWGGIGGNSLWGYKGVKMWGTGNGTNYLARIASAVAAIFGLRLSRSERSNARTSGGSTGGSGRTGGNAPRTAARSSR